MSSIRFATRLLVSAAPILNSSISWISLSVCLLLRPVALRCGRHGWSSKRVRSGSTWRWIWVVPFSPLVKCVVAAPTRLTETNAADKKAHFNVHNKKSSCSTYRKLSGSLLNVILMSLKDFSQFVNTNLFGVLTHHGLTASRSAFNG